MLLLLLLHRLCLLCWLRLLLHWLCLLLLHRLCLLHWRCLLHWLWRLTRLHTCSCCWR
jgi:hypothetical protein